MGGGGEVHVHFQVNAIDVAGVQKFFMTHGQTMTKSINRYLGKFGKNLLGSSYT